MADCRICERPTHTVDELGPVHPCCLLWARLTPGKPCKACSESRGYRATWRGQKKAKV